MLPLKDDIPSLRFPAITLALILANVAAFLFELTLDERLDQFVMFWGLVPVRYTQSDIARLFSVAEQAIPFLTSMFLHGGWLHLIANMWTLWIFGDNVEDRLGRLGYLTFYLSGGLIAGVLHICTNAASSVPTIGASGAIAAIMGGYFRFYPRANVSVLVPPFLFGPFLVVPAVVFLGWWFILQFFSGTFSLLRNPKEVGGIAWWAHIGGFIFGVLICSLVKWRQSSRLRESRMLEEVIPISWH